MQTETPQSDAIDTSPQLQRLSHVLVDEAHARLVNNIAKYMSVNEIALISHACHFADDAHIKDKRKSGEPYVTHPIAVANILADYQVDTDTIIAAILHDTIEDTEVSKQQITDLFNATIADLVDGVTKLKISDNKAINKAATFRKILTATLKDPRVIIIKLADRMHNMSTMTAVRPAKRISTSEETLEFYLPFARVMGLNDIADTLELLCFENLDAEQFEYFYRRLSQRKLTREHRSKQIADYFYKKMSLLTINGKVHLTNNKVDLFRSFFNHKRDVDHLLNRYKFTVEFDNVSACDAFVKLLKNRFSIKKEAIKDHIRKPFSGGYQAIHIEYEMNDEYIELIVQTSTMYKASRYGVMLGDKAPLNSQHKLQASLKNLYELIDNDCAETTIEALFDYFDKDKIIVNTPDGDLFELPIDATVLDFAYAVSDFLGNHAVGAVINGSAVPLATKLKNGQTILIKTNPLSFPNPEWLGFITTSTARMGLQNWLKQQTQEEQIFAGKEALTRAIKDNEGYASSGKKELSENDWQALFEWQNTSEKNTIYQRIATGDLLPQLLISKLFSDRAATNPIQKFHQAKHDTVILGTKGIELHYGNCCNPILGDKILGLLTHNGLAVHRHRCYSIIDIQHKHPEKLLPLKWNKFETDGATDPMFNVMLNINKVCSDDEISSIIYKLHEMQVGVNDIYCDNGRTLAYLMVMSRDHVAQITRELRVLLGFPSVKRLYRYD